MSAVTSTIASMNDSAQSVRPTKRVIETLGVPLPNLGTRLSSLNHPLVSKAQITPTEVEQHSADRIRSLTDRVWFKVKASRWRGAVSDLFDALPEGLASYGERWWLCAAGVRQDDSAQSDFYAMLSREAHSRGPHSCSTDFLLPTEWDAKRLVAEAAVFATHVLHQLVLSAASDSLLTGVVSGFEFGERDVRVRIKVHEDGEAYVGIGATGVADVALFVTLFSAFPGVDPADWMAEPDGALAITPAPGEILWSAMLPPATQQFLAAREWENPRDFGAIPGA